jgi:hypothetical protein
MIDPELRAPMSAMSDAGREELGVIMRKLGLID